MPRLQSRTCQKSCEKFARERRHACWLVARGPLIAPALRWTCAKRMLPHEMLCVPSWIWKKIFGETFMQSWGLFEVRTKARLKDEYLLRPDLGRHFDDDSREQIQSCCSCNNDLQIAIGDGLSCRRLRRKVALLLPLLCEGAKKRHWKIGGTSADPSLPGGILNDGALLEPAWRSCCSSANVRLIRAAKVRVLWRTGPALPTRMLNRDVISNVRAASSIRGEAATTTL